MRQHLETHLKPEHRPKRVKRFECDFCSKSFYEKQNLKSHMMTRHVIKEKLIKCNQCKYSGKSEHDLKRHMTVHNKSFKCTKCDEVFSLKRSLAHHLKNHELPKEFVCHCNKTFKSSSALKNHKIRSHKEKPAGERAFKCKTCDYAGTTAALLKCHEATHVKKFKCNNCSKMYAFEKDLQKHLSHKPTSQFSCFRDKDFACKICRKVFLNRQLLVQHSLSHADRIQCSICQQTLSANSMNNHKNYHKIKDQEPKFKCDICTKTFYFIAHLRSHVKVHKTCVVTK
jgi:KRAB domain-containing zinc finger protein